MSFYGRGELTGGLKKFFLKLGLFLSHNRSEAIKTGIVLINPRFLTNSGSLTPFPTLGNSDSN